MKETGTLRERKRMIKFLFFSKSIGTKIWVILKLQLHHNRDDASNFKVSSKPVQCFQQGALTNSCTH